MSSRRSTVAIGVAFSIAVAIRSGFLLWSPLPATLDGFGYAAKAVEVASSDHTYLTNLAADELVLTTVLAVVSQITGVSPLYFAQPLVAVLGGAAALSGYIVVRSLGHSLNWPRARIRRAGALVVGLLALEGIFLRRTGVPDEDVIGLLLVPLIALAAHRTIASRERRWIVVFVAVACVYPPLHNLSAIVAAFVLSALAAGHVANNPTKHTLGRALGVAGGYWVYFFGYYTAAEQVGLTLTYTSIIREFPGALLAWLTIVVVGVAWVKIASPQAMRVAATVPLLGFFALVVLNLFRPVFPGTLQTHPLVMVLIAAYVVPVTIFVWGVPQIRRGDGIVALSLIVGPIGFVLFALTTSLTPDFLGAAMRSQTFAHYGVFGGTAVAVVALAARRPWASRVLVAVLIAAALVTAPLAFIHLDTGTAPRTVHESEFAGVEFATKYVSGPYTSDDRLARAGSYFDGPGGTKAPTRTWIFGGPPPNCATIAQQSWTTAGAHFYPSPPGKLSAEAYREWKASVDIIYSTTGWTETVIGNSAGC